MAHPPPHEAAGCRQPAHRARSPRPRPPTHRRDPRSAVWHCPTWHSAAHRAPASRPRRARAAPTPTTPPLPCAQVRREPETVEESAAAGSTSSIGGSGSALLSISRAASARTAARAASSWRDASSRSVRWRAVEELESAERAAWRGDGGTSSRPPPWLSRAGSFVAHAPRVTNDVLSAEGLAADLAPLVPRRAMTEHSRPRPAHEPAKGDE